jgi:sphinganine-1-phosphate aldolase
MLFLTLPPMASKVEPQMAEARRTIQDKLIPSGPQVVRYLSLPSEGQSKDWILAEMDRMDSYCHSFDKQGVKLHDWKDGKISGAVYRECVPLPFDPSCMVLSVWEDGGQDLTNLIVAAYERYCVSNPLHPDIFPTVRKMEAEVVSMCLRSAAFFLQSSAAGLTSASQDVQ